jgi:hypothetical protein
MRKVISLRSKKGFELSINMIIVVILGFALLGVGLVIIGKLGNIPIDIPQTCDISPPTESSPVCITGNLEVTRGKEFVTTVGVYNDENADFTAGVLPSITCSQDIDGNVLNIQTASAGSIVPVGETASYKVIIKIPKDAARSMYPCTFAISDTQKQFSITVK